jgi:hypothetical protein
MPYLPVQTSAASPTIARLARTNDTYFAPSPALLAPDFPAANATAGAQKRSPNSKKMNRRAKAQNHRSTRRIHEAILVGIA